VQSAFFNKDLDYEDRTSEHSSDSEGLVLEKDNIEMHNFPTEEYRQLVQEATYAHLAMQEERETVELKLTKINQQLKNIQTEFDEISKKWDENSKESNIVVC
jgi:hypothetical protein